MNDVLQHCDNEVRTLLQPLEEEEDPLARFTVSKLLPQLKNQLDLILELKLRIGVDLRSQFAQIGHWNRWRIRQRFGKRRRFRQEFESPLQALESFYAPQAVVYPSNRAEEGLRIFCPRAEPEVVAFADLWHI